MRRRVALWCGGALLALAAGARAAPPTPAPPTGYDQALGAAKAAMVSEPRAALELARKAERFAAGEPRGSAQELRTATADWLEAEAMIRLKHPEPALAVLKTAAAAVSRLSPTTKLQADVLKSKGRAFAALGQVQFALADYQAAFKIYQTIGEARGEAMALQEIGSLYTAARDYARVMQYYAQSNETYSKDPTLALVAHNNLGFALKETGRLKEAESEFRRALTAATEIGSTYLQAQILSNIAFVQTLSSDATAEATVMKGLVLTNRDAATATERPFLVGVLARLRLQQGRLSEARALIEQTFEHVDPSTEAPDFREFHAIAAQIYERVGAFQQALVHEHALKKVDDQSEVLASSTNSALMAAQFDFANQDLKITKLRAGQLERDVLLARSQAKLRTFLIVAGLVAGGGVFGVTLLGFMGMRRSRNAVQAVNADLKRALEAKTTFLATTSHEIRTPLNGILGMTQVLLTDRELRPPVRERLELMRGAGEAMKVLVDDLLDTAKAEKGEIGLEPRPTQLRRVLQDVAELWRGQAELRHLKLTLEMDGVPEVVDADEARLRQLLFNLISNALKFTEKGSVILAARGGEGGLTLEVRDTGIGIAKSEHERIFEPFTQVDGGTTRKFGGTGLGLTISRSICRAMSGTLTVESEPGVGTVFTAQLPDVRGVLPVPQPASSDGRFSSARVLVVDPNPLAQSILRACLGPQVASVACVGDGAAAVEHVASAGADLVIIDAAALKPESGPPLATFKALQDSAQAPLLIVTCPSQEVAAFAHLRHAGAFELVPKPIAPLALASVVAGAWERAKTAEALLPAA